MASIAERIHKPSPDIGKIAATIYARKGVGKTTLLGTIPGRGLILDTALTEGGTMVLSHLANRIDVLSINQWDDFEQALVYLQGGHPYAWASVDSMTGAQVYAKGKTVKDRTLDTDPAIVSMQEDGKIGELMAMLVYRLRALDMHVVITAQERERGTEKQPDVSPASLSALLPPMYLVGRLYTAEVTNADGVLVDERRLRVGPHPNFTTAARAIPGRSLPSVIREPNLGQIFGYLLGVDVPRPEEVVMSTGFLVTAEEN